MLVNFLIFISFTQPAEDDDSDDADADADADDEEHDDDEEVCTSRVAG